MPSKKSLSTAQYCIAAAVMSLSFMSLAQATDSHIETNTPAKSPAPATIRNTDAQPGSHQPQQATPSQPASETEPVDGDDTALA